MAQSRFSRHTDDSGNTEKITQGAPQDSLSSKAKRTFGSITDKLMNLLSGEQTDQKGSRTASADTPFVPPEDIPTPAKPAVTAATPAPSAPEEITPSAAPETPKGRFRAASSPSQPKPQPSPTPDLSDDFSDDFLSDIPSVSKPVLQDTESSLPSRWDARSKDSDLFFSERMTDRGFKAKTPKEFEEKKRTEYRGEVQGLSTNANDSDDGEHYYVPNIEVGDEDRRTRYKRRNRRPLKMWQKSVITGVCITAAFLGLIFLTVNLMLIGKMNQINVKGTKDLNDLYIYEPSTVTSILDDSVSISEDDRNRLSKLNDAFELSDLAVKSGKKVQNFLIVALDEQRQADGMVIVSIDEKTKKVRLVNIIPDLYVPLADQIDGVNYGSSLRKIYTYGGADVLRDTVEDTLKVKIDYYFVLNFTAFETMVNHLGGASITITDENISYWMATNKFDPQKRFGGTGRFTLNGEEALIYSRMSQLDDEFARSLRQQELAAKLCESLSEFGTLEHVSVLYNTLSYVTTDCGAGKMLGLCGKLKKYGDYEVKGVTVPISGTYKEGYVGGEYLLASNLTVNANDIQLFLYSNDMTYADGGTEVNVMLPELTEVLDVPKEPVSGSDMSATDAPSANPQ